VSATGGIATEPRLRGAKKMATDIPYLKIMAVIIVLVLLGLAWLALSGY
jgi:hypothetical protein